MTQFNPAATFTSAAVTMRDEHYHVAMPELAFLKLSDLQWMTRICRSIVKLQELTPRSKHYLQCTEMIKIIERLEAPY